jgi:hypothetical protein
MAFLFPALLPIMVVKKVAGGVSKARAGDSLPSSAETKLEKRLVKLDRNAHNSPADRRAALEAHLKLETLREERHLRLLAKYQQEGDSVQVQQQESILQGIREMKRMYMQQMQQAYGM